MRKAATCSQSCLPLPDSKCMPGAYYSALTQSTICVSGWTATVRPPTSYTNPLRVQGVIDHGYSDTRTAGYEEDHLMPLELGGSPTATTHLWPEPHSGTETATAKDGVETKVKNAVCAGTITLASARSAIRTNWATAPAVTGIG
ncbi:hypothetical protein [Streptomyces sp. NPDC001980]|uniref:hypothetical protein n=1 Tax=Streptomyces sp. NPDC001980 TaxID=3157126 RepID=UPI00331B77BE